MFGVAGEQQHTRSPGGKGVPTAQAPLMTAKSSVLPDRRDDGQEAWREFADARGLEPQPLPLEAGEVVLLSPFLLHTSGTNSTTTARRAFSVELMPEHTRTRDDEILGATILFPGGKEGALVGKDPALRKRDGGAGEEELRRFAERHAQARL